jgi:undecaprenyl diphosphate synthase
LDEESFRANLLLPEMPDPDLLIRTAGEKRVSNFLLYQLSYTELMFVDTLWPDFDEKELDSAVDEFQNRVRKYGNA